MSDSCFRYAGLGEVKRAGLSVQSAAARLHHLSFVEKRLMFFCAAHLVGTPIRDLKLLLGRAQFLAAERCSALRKRLQELRVPKIRVDKRPSEALELAMDEALHCENSKEAAGIAHALHAKLVTAYVRYLDQTNQLADSPSCDLISSQLPLLRGITESVEAFIEASGEHQTADSTGESSFPRPADPTEAADAATNYRRGNARKSRSKLTGMPAVLHSPPPVWDYIKPLPGRDCRSFRAYAGNSSFGDQRRGGSGNRDL